LGRSDSETEFRIVAAVPSVYGRTRLRLKHEVKPFGVLLDGSNTASDGFLDIGDDGEIGLDRLVTGLTADTQYHWRVRAQYDLTKTPFQPYGPWIHMPTNGWNEADLRTNTGDPAGIPHDVEGLSVALALRTVGANPGDGHCAVLLTLDHPSRVDATVIDVQGRTIAVLLDDAGLDAGSHVLAWDGRERSGIAPAGVYFISVRAGEGVRAQKIVLSR
jgi:hypothetical protein